MSAKRIARPGDFLVCSLAGESIVVLRGEKANFALFSMFAAADRASFEACGSIRAFRCLIIIGPMAWTDYLRGAPGILDQISKEDFSLHPVWVGLDGTDLYQSESEEASLTMAQMLEVAAPEMTLRRAHQRLPNHLLRCLATGNCSWRTTGNVMPGKPPGVLRHCPY
jgi:hypothetical protein